MMLALQAYLQHFLTNPLNVMVLVGSLSFSALFYLLFRTTEHIKIKVTYLYIHIFFLFLPFLFTAFTADCWSCVVPVCECSPQQVIYGVIGGIAVAFIGSFFSLPYMYTWANKSQEIVSGTIQQLLQKHARSLRMRPPKLYLLNDLNPMAYSITNIRPSIFLSVGLCELLSEQEMEAVLLHELHHVHHQTSFWRFSTNMLKIFSPLATFITLDNSLSKEEQAADAFASRIQGTDLFLCKAKEKVEELKSEMREYRG